MKTEYVVLYSGVVVNGAAVMPSNNLSEEPNFQRATKMLPDSDSWELARRLADGDMACCNALLEKLGSPPPFMTWNPSPEDLQDEGLRHLDRWWREVAASQGGVPSPKAVDPLMLRPALGYVSLLDVLDDGRDFTIRLHGSGVRDTLGVDMTGMSVCEMTVPFMAYLIVTYRAQLIRPELLLVRYTPAMEFFLSAWWRIGLPLMTDGKVVRLLIGMARAPRQMAE